MSARRVVCGVVAVLACHEGTAHSQGIEGRVGRFYEGEGWTLYQLGLSRPLIGPLGTSTTATYLRRVGGVAGGFAGIGLDLTAFRGAGAGPYAVAGVGAGLGSPHTQSFSSLWTSWSAGVGYELVPATFLRIGAEGRYRRISLDRRDGLEFAAGVSLNLGGGPKPRRDVPSRVRAAGADSGSGASHVSGSGASSRVPDAGQVPTEAPAGGSPVTEAVIATATSAMGRPYRYGGTGADGGGFDCSGLIQYAYGAHGIVLPRRSEDQARKGKRVRKSPAALRPGDLLTFSNRGGRVTHVGLYVGHGEFIHSATRGVQLSALSADDPYGRWWYRRWVGVRRIVR